jgi:NADPH:quinone reductase-like Zn-dependent oxidoreductase
MKAVAYRTPGSIDREDALQDITLEIPKAEGCDLLVKITAVSVNPVDTKLRLGVAPEGDDWRILGFDAAGVVEAVGPEVQNFKSGDTVFYAGSIARPGTNSEYHLVDERIVGRKPTSLSDAEAAALPLTAITAWEMLFTRSLFGTPDMAEQGKLLNEVSTLVDAGRIRSTATEVAGKIDAATLRAVHARIESGSARGKIVLEGF